MARHLILSLILTFLFSTLGLAASECSPGNPDYCLNEWKEDPLLVIFKDPKYNPYAQYVCTTYLQPTIVRPGTTSTKTIGGPTSTAKVTLTETTTTTKNGATTKTITGEDKTVTESTALVTVTEYGGTETITIVVNHGSTSTISGATVTETVATVTRTVSEVTRTHTSTSTDNVGSTKTVTVTDGTQTQTNTICTATDVIFSKTNVNQGYHTYTTRINTRTTGTRTVLHVTGSTIIRIPRETTRRETKYVHVTHVDRQTRFKWTSTQDIKHVVGTETIVKTDTQTELKTTTTRTDYQTIGTETKTAVTHTDLVRTTSTFSVENLATTTLTTVTGTTTDTYTTEIEYVTDFYPDLAPIGKRMACAATRPALGDIKHKKDGWLDQYGEEHFKSACSCIVHFPLPTRTVYHPPHTSVELTITPSTTVTETATDTDVRTTGSTTTIISEVGGHTKTITLVYVSTKTIAETVTSYLTLGTTSVQFTTRTSTKPVTHTVTEGPTKSITVTRTVTDTDDQTSTVRVGSRTVTEVKNDVCTSYRDLDITKTSSVIDERTSDVAVDQSIGVETTLTSSYDVTKTLSLTETTTHLTTFETTIGGVLTRTIPVISTDTQKVVQTVTVFTDATTTIQVQDTTTVGVITTSTVLTITTVGQNYTRTITTTSAIESTVSAVATATQTCGLPIVNGGFEDGEEPWYLSWEDYAGGYVTDPGYNSNFRFQSNNLINGDRLEFYQDMETCPGVTFQCQYDYRIENYYETQYSPGGSIWIPYVRVYISDDWPAISNQFPWDEQDVGFWRTAPVFEYTSAEDGKDRFWFTAGSPQPQHPSNSTLGGSGDNYVSIDNVRCWPKMNIK